MKARPIAKYCVACGAALEEVLLPGDHRSRQRCPRCSHVHYDNPKVLVCTLITFADRLLMCQRAHQPGYGRWALPGGFLECGETLEQGAARETHEETGVVIRPEHLSIYNVATLTDLGEVYVAFRGVAENPLTSPGAESLQACYFSLHDMPWSELAFFETEPYIRLFFEELATGRFGIHISSGGEVTSVGRSFEILN